MRRTQVKRTEVTIKGKPFYLVTWPLPFGPGRARQCFKSFRASEAFLEEKKRERDEFGRQGMLTSGDRLLFAGCCEALKPFGKTLRDATEFYVEHLKATEKSCTVGKFVGRYIKDKEAALARGDLQKCTVTDIRSRLNKFAEKFGAVGLGQVGLQDIEPWLNERGKTQNRRNFYTVVSGMFNEAVRLEHIAANPMRKISKPKKSNGAKELYSVDELQKLLTVAKATAPDVLPIIALGAFAGVRSDFENGEISKLQYSAIEFARSRVDLSAAVTKKSKRRAFQFQPNLAAWLEPYRGKTGKIVQAGARKKLDAVCEAAGVVWKRNALRHSFASYRLEATQNAPTVAYELGHPTPNLLYSTYRELVTPEAAAAYWQITP